MELLLKFLADFFF